MSHAGDAGTCARKEWLELLRRLVGNAYSELYKLRWRLIDELMGPTLHLGIIDGAVKDFLLAIPSSQLRFSRVRRVLIALFVSWL